MGEGQAELVRSDTSRYSYHVDDGYYAGLLDELRRWDPEWAPVDPPTLRDCEALLFLEARLLDDARFEEWTDLLTADCVYWLPVTPGGGDPRGEVTLAFDDRRRILDRVYWLRTGLAYSQIPPSRTRRMISNVEASWGADPGELRVRSNFVVWEFRVGIQRALAGWYAHLLRRVDGVWRIAVKQANLIDSEYRHENLTVVF
jgi:3-phenylpropionate/cinnamic acid dioxygenase small subunit